jgi:iron complex transport system substrate-binding protein
VNPNYERIVALDPDLILSQGRAEDLKRFAVERGIAFTALPLTDLASILDVIRQAGNLLEVAAHADLLASKMRYELAQVRARISDHSPARVLLVTGRQTGTLSAINTVGSGSFLNGLLEAAGGRNVFGDLERAYATVSKEALVQREPEVIVELHGEGGDHARLLRQVRDMWAGLPSLPAVRTGRIHVVESTYALIPGPRVVKLAERLARVIHVEGG